MVRATFGSEIVGRRVLDAAGDELGRIEDFSIDPATGHVVDLLVLPAGDIDPERLPWPFEGGRTHVPAAEVDRIETDVHLSI